MFKKILVAIVILVMIGGLTYGAQTKSPTTQVLEKHEGGFADGRPSYRVESGAEGANPDIQRNQGDHQPAEDGTTAGEIKGRQSGSLQSQVNQDKQSISRSANWTSSSIRNAGTFTVTAYTAGPESTGKSPGHPAYGITATGTTVQENHTVAADWSVLPPDTKLMIEGLEHVYTVEDRGSAIQGKRLDIYIEDLEAALKWGVQERKVTIIKLGGK